MYISTCFPPLCVVSKIGLSTIRYFLNIHLFLNVVIMTLNYVLYPILVQNLENVNFEGIYLFTLHKHTETINSTIRLHSHYITSIEKTCNDGDLSGVGRSLWGRLWLWFKSSGFRNLRQHTTVTNQCYRLPWTWTWRIQYCDCWSHSQNRPVTV